MRIALVPQRVLRPAHQIRERNARLRAAVTGGGSACRSADQFRLARRDPIDLLGHDRAGVADRHCEEECRDDSNRCR